MKRLFIAVVVALVLPASAQASQWLPRAEAHRSTVKFVQHLYDKVQGTVAWEVDETGECERVARNAVDCGFSITIGEENEKVCPGVLHVRLVGKWLYRRVSWSLEPGEICG